MILWPGGSLKERCMYFLFRVLRVDRQIYQYVSVVFGCLTGEILCFPWSDYVILKGKFLITKNYLHGINLFQFN